jgi:hypothetical protein
MLTKEEIEKAMQEAHDDMVQRRLAFHVYKDECNCNWCRKIRKEGAKL